MDGVWSHPVPLVPAVAGSLSRDAVIDPQGAAAGALWQQNVWMVCARGCHGPATCFTDLPHLFPWV